jgi:thiol-disulfide isomerase/thioredoxin
MGRRWWTEWALAGTLILDGIVFGRMGFAAPPIVAAVPGMDLTAFRGKVVYVDFWASWCVPCRQSFPWMNEMQKRFGKDGFVIVAVNMDQVRGDAEGFLKQYPAEFIVRFDPQGQLAGQLKVRGMPTSALLARDGRVLWTHEGFRSKDSASLEQSIRAALQ